MGEEGKDFVHGGRGADHIVGGEGPDWLIEGDLRNFSKDIVSGGDGNDIFVVDNVPAVKDIVSCGGSFDRVLADRRDVVGPDCEKVVIVHGSRAEIVEQEEAFFESRAAREFFEGFFEGLAPDPTAGG